jgi:ribosomal protein S6--L-glutamate ligase
MAVALKMAGIPTPVTRFGSPRELARGVPRPDFPLILKPVFGDNGNGLRIVQNAAELESLPWPGNVVLAQKFEPNDGYDLKLYCIGEEVWVVRKPSGPIIGGAANRAAERVQTTAQLRSLARQCGELFGLDLYGVDCIETPTGVVVIEVNDFPNYSAVPKASEKLAAYVLCKIGQRGPA